MQRLFLLFSHTLTSEQVREAKESLHCSEILYLPEELQKKWSNVDPNGELDSKLIDEFISYLSTHTSKDDYVLIQGDFGMCYTLVKWCHENARIPIYSTTYRNSFEEEKAEGKIKKTHTFEHINFRRYPK